jgi:hypothetical protein
MDWRLKCLAFHVLRWMPRSVYVVLQKRVTGRYFFRLSDQELKAYQYHVTNYRRLGHSGRVLEFGAGPNLLSALLLSEAGATEVVTYDIDRIATVEQVNDMIRQLRASLGGAWPEVVDLGDDLVRKYRVRYCAPGDARDTGLPPGSVDLVCSTSTLEHIPAADISAILKECRRIASANALYSFIIDYHDHYATADPSISRVNFYRYSDAVWKLFNPPNHYQNRLRHADFVSLFRRENLEAIEARAVIREVDLGRVHPHFHNYTPEDLMALNGLFCLRAAR